MRDFTIKIHVKSDIQAAQEVAGSAVDLLDQLIQSGVTLTIGGVAVTEGAVTDEDYAQDDALDSEYGEWVREHTPSPAPLPQDFPQV